MQNTTLNNFMLIIHKLSVAYTLEEVRHVFVIY
jgi:hypothetical protein